MIIYGVKGYQTDVDGIVYDNVFVLDDTGDFVLQTNLDMNGFDIKNYALDLPGYRIDGSTIKLQKDLDLNGYSLKNFQPRTIITGEWKSDENKIFSKTFVKFGNNIRVMVPFPCLLDGISALIIDKGASLTFERIGFAFRIPGTLLTNLPFKSIRNADGLKYQYVEPRTHEGKRQKLDAGQYFVVNLSHPSNPNINLSNTKHVLVSLILIDDFSFR